MIYETEAKWYVLYRDAQVKQGWDILDTTSKEYTIVFAINPLHGNGSWNLLSGIPNDTQDSAAREVAV